MYSSCRRDIGFDKAGSFYDILRAIDKNVIELRQKRESGRGYLAVSKSHILPPIERIKIFRRDQAFG
jgi:hypothetical protein